MTHIEAKLCHIEAIKFIDLIFFMMISGASQVALVVKKLSASAGDVRDMGSIPRLGRSPGEGHNNPLQYSCLEKPMGRRAWQATVHRVEHNWTRLKQLSTRAQPSSQAVTGNFKKLWKVREVWEN